MDVKRQISYDVAVVGAGNAGLVAAIEARNHGLSVLLLDKGPRERRGGNSRLADGQFRVAFNNGLSDFEYLLEGSSIPKGQIEIEPYPGDQYYADIMCATEGLADQQWTEIIVNESMSVVRWMKDQGFRGWILDPSTAIKKNGGLFWPSGEVILSSGSGETLVEGLFRIAESKQVEILYETSAQSLITDSEGDVVGLVAKSRDGMIRIEAKAVILACGGFESSPEMRRRYLGDGWDLVKVRGTRHNTGDGLSMAIAIGAQTCGHWGCCHASIVSADSPNVEGVGTNRYSYIYGIMINTLGRRFVDEGENFIGYTYARMGREILKQPGALAYQIFDSKVFQYLKPEYENAIYAEGKTIEELAEEIDIDPATFSRTVREFNQAIVPSVKFDPTRRDGLRTHGLNPDKTNWALPIDTPPYRAFAVVCGITFSYGGLKVNNKCQVLDTRDIPIGGLYCVGEMAGGVFHYNCPAGTGLVKGAIQGRIAAADAAAGVSGRVT